MKHHRIKNRLTTGFIIQERYWIFFWRTIKDYEAARRLHMIMNAPDMVLPTVKEAKQFLLDKLTSDIGYKTRLKRAKYIEYI